MTNEIAKKKITRARIAMLMQQPFFGYLGLRLKIVENDKLEIPTLATNGKILYYHPQWVLDHEHEVIMSGVAHEIAHCIFDHLGRRNGRQPMRWNYANDFVVNALLKDAGFTVPHDWLFDPAFAGMNSDQVYNLLPDEPEGEGKGPFDEHMDPAGDKAAQADDWKVAAGQAAKVAKEAGKLPASMERFVDEILYGKADWRAVLRRFVTERARDDFSFTRPNRKYASLGIFLPGLYSEAMGEMGAAIDTSGSITAEILKEFGGEITALCDQMKPPLMRVIYCDRDINHVDEFEQYDPLVFKPHGGGGTDFRPPFAWMEANGVTPKCFVYLTDGYGPFPDEPPPFPVLWLMTTEVVPPWGEVVRIEV